MELDDLYRAYVHATREDARREAEVAKERLGAGLDTWVRAYLRPRVARGRVRDYAQSAIETVWEGIDGFVPEHEEAFGRWVGSVARILVMRERQRGGLRARRQGKFESPDFCHPGPGPLTVLRRRERAQRIESELRGLDSKLRRALEDQLEGNDVHSFAARHGLPAATVRTHRRRARERLQERLAARERTPSTLP